MSERAAALKRRWRNLRRAAGTRRGVAILIVVAVLAGLTALAAPFVMSMVLHARQARNDVTSLQARSGAEAAIAHATAQLYKTAIPPDPLDEQHFVTTPADLRVDMDFPAASPALGKLGVSVQGNGGLFWSARVEDEQGKINLTTAHPAVLGNLMGSALLTDNAAKGAMSLSIDDPTRFRPDGGTIYMNGEDKALKYSRVQGNVIALNEGLTRAHGEGELVYDGRARLIADYKNRPDNKSYLPLRSIYELKAAVEGNDVIAPDEFARLERHITVQSGLGGPLWGHGQAQDTSRSVRVARSAVVEKGDGFTPGGLVRGVQGGEVVFYARLVNVALRGDGSASIVFDRDATIPPVENNAEVFVLQPEFQHPVNINTATTDVLEAVFTGLCMFGQKEAISRQKAQLLVDLLHENGRVFTSRDDLKKAFDEAHNRGILSAGQRDACYINATEPNSPKLRTSTVPFVFRTFGHLTVEGSGLVNSDNGVPLSRNIQRQLISLPTPWPGNFKIQYQRQFQELIDKGLGSRVVTFPEPMGAQRYRRNVTGVRRGMENTGGVRLDVGETGPMKPERDATEFIDHCDDPNDPGFRQDGYDMSKRGPFDVKLGTTASGGNGPGGNRRGQSDNMVRFGASGQNRNNSNNNNQNNTVGGVATVPTAVEMWYKPLGGGQCVFYDESLEEDRNRVTFSYEPGKGLVLQVCDAGFEMTAMKVNGWNHRQRKPVEYVYPINLTPGDWHHVAASWKQGGYNGMEIRYDAQPVPPTNEPIVQKPSTKLSKSLAVTDLLSVELDDAPDEDFPKMGAIQIGEEIIEYHLKQGNTLLQLNRGARMSAMAKHDAGEAVVPFGFSVGIGEDWYIGGGYTTERIGTPNEARTTVNKTLPNGQPDFITDNETTIPVQDASSFPKSGFIICSGELIFYAKRSATAFQNCERAVPAYHAEDQDTKTSINIKSRNLRHGQEIRLASIEVDRTSDYPETGRVQIDSETDATKVEWFRYASRESKGGKQFLVASFNDGPYSRPSRGRPEVQATAYEPHLHIHDFRSAFGIGQNMSHGKKEKVIPVIRVNGPHCGGFNTAYRVDSPYGDDGVSEISVIERGSTNGDLMWVKQAYINQWGSWSYTNNGGKLTNCKFNGWGIDYLVGLNDFLSRRFPRSTTRITKWPSGELPDAINAKRIVGADRAGQGQIRGHVDEIKVNTYETQGCRIAMTTDGTGIESSDDEILLESYNAWTPNGNRNDNIRWPQAGLIRIEDELIYYSRGNSQGFQYYADTFSPLTPVGGQAAGRTKSDHETRNPCTDAMESHPNIKSGTGFRISGLVRGALGSDKSAHPVGAKVFLYDGMAVTQLSGPMSQDTISIKDGAGFPYEGYVWIGDEAISYLQNDHVGPGATVLKGIENYRGRFGTREGSHDTTEIVRCLPFRYFDRNPLFTDARGTAFIQAGHFAQDAIWDSVEIEVKGTDEYPKPNAIRPRILARFDGKPSWAAEPSNVDGGLWEFRNKEGVIPIRGESARGAHGDEAEVRVYWEFRPGAFIPNTDWKRTFQIEKLRMTYRTPLILRRLDEIERR
jgi:hypothetical protein